LFFLIFALRPQSPLFPYTTLFRSQTHWFEMIRKRGFWLILLFFFQLLTASAMSFFEDEIQKAVVLTLFVPLIISSGGNTGSQARSEEHTSELQSRENIVCRLLLEK